MRRILLASLVAAFGAVFSGAEPSVALEIGTSIDLDYNYSQADVGGDVNAAAAFNQAYAITYTTSLTTAYDFSGAVRLALSDSWYTNAGATSRVSPTLEVQTKGSQLAAKVAYEAALDSNDSYHESAEVTNYSTSLLFDLQITPVVWPQVTLKYQKKNTYQAYTSESTSNSFGFSATKDIYGVRLGYTFNRQDDDHILPDHTSSASTKWSFKATYKEILWSGVEFNLAYSIAEEYKDSQTRGVFSGETSSYEQNLKTRLRKSLEITPRMKLGVTWEYQFAQDLLALDYDYKLDNQYALDLHWDAYDWLKIKSEARHSTTLTAAAEERSDDERALTDNFKAGFDLAAVSWLTVFGNAEFSSKETVAANSGGSVAKDQDERYELIVRNSLGKAWDFTWNGSTSISHEDDVLKNRDTKVKADLKIGLGDLTVTSGYAVSRVNQWEELFEFPTGQQQTREAKIRFEYLLQLTEMFKATFSHEYGIKVDDKLDEVLNFERQLQFNESTRLTFVLAEIYRDLKIDGEIERRASDSEDDPDPELVGLSYALKLDWKIRKLSVFSSIKYNDKGNTFDDVSFSTRASWGGERLKVSGEYQFDKIIKDITDPKEERRRLNLKLSYRF